MRNIKLIKTLILFIVYILYLHTGCSITSNRVQDQRQEAIKCARNWKAQGYNFDPNTMTCLQMFRRVQAMRRAKYWKQKGYNLDPNFMNGEEMDQKVKDIDRSRYWKQHGYDFDPYSMTARQMDKQAEELNEVELWKKRGYYYDPNSKTVFIDKQKRTKLKSLAGLHGGGTSFPSISPRSAYLSAKILPPVSISPSGNGKIYLFTGGGHWVKNKIDSGNFIQLEDNSLWQVSPIDRINCSLWLNMDEIAVIESQNPYYPYLLINTDDAEKVEAKLISD